MQSVTGILAASTFRELGVDATDKALGPDTDRGGGSRTGGQWLPALDASTLPPGHEGYDPGERSRLLLLEPIFIPRPDNRWGLYANAERAMRSQHS